MDFLNLCKEHETKVIFPNKMLEFDKKIARSLIKTNSVLNYSNCRDKSEVGAVTQGFTNRWRILQAEKYADAGVNTTITITCDVTQSFEDNERRGFSIGEALEAETKGMTIRLLPLRIKSKKFCYEVTENRWEEVIRPKDYENFLNFGMWHYSKKGNNEAIPLFLHEDFQKLVDRGIGICGGVGEIEYCDKCNLEKNIRIMFPKSELAQVIYLPGKLRYKRHSKKLGT